MVSKLEEFKRYLKDYRKLVLLCIDNEDALETFCGKRDATEVLEEIQDSQWWKILFGLTSTLNMLDRTTGDNLPKFRYEFKTPTLGIPRIIEHPTDCIDYVFNAYNSLPSVYRPQPLDDKDVIFYPSIPSQARTMLRNKGIIDLGQQEKKYEEANLGALQDKDSLQAGQGEGKAVETPETSNEASKEYDVFLCHASEGKDSFVRPLAQALRDRGLKVWFDEFSLKLGDRLRESIEGGLNKSRYGVIVLSKDFFRKKWPQEELDGLLSLESREKKILPIWHRVNEKEVKSYSPILATRVATETSKGLTYVVEKIIEVVKDP